MQKHLLLAIGIAVTLGACRERRQSHGPAAPPSAGETAELRSASLMLHHETYAIAVRDAIVRGDLDAAHRNAKELGYLTMEETPEVVDYQARALKAAAAGIAVAPDLATAAHAVGPLVQTCGDCHARATGPTRLAVEPAPLPEKGRRTRMRRHIWAMNELWDGLVGNSEDPWHAGAEVLSDPTLAASELAPTKTSTPEVDRLAASVQSLGVRARAASDTGVRSAIYGELLATCADCHARMR